MRERGKGLVCHACCRDILVSYMDCGDACAFVASRAATWVCEGRYIAATEDNHNVCMCGRVSVCVGVEEEENLY